MIQKALLGGISLVLVIAIGLSMRGRDSTELDVPLIHVKVSSIDAGTIPLTDDPLLFDYQIENWGKAPLRINGTVLSCGCTQPEIPQSEIAPNQSARVRLRIDPEAAGEKQVSVLLLTNDPVNPRYALKARWIATNGISADPPNLEFGTVEAGRSSSHVVKILKLDDRIQVNAVSGEPASVQAQLDGDQLTVTLVAEPYPINGQGLVRLMLAGAKTRPFLIPIRWHVDHAYQAHPSSLFLGYAKPGSDLTGSLSVKDREGRDVAVKSWEWQQALPGASCESNQDADGLAHFQVKWTAPSTAGMHRGVVAIRVAEHTLQVPVSALVGATGK